MPNSIIVYRNPFEQMFWEQGGIEIFASLLLVLIVAGFVIAGITRGYEIIKRKRRNIKMKNTFSILIFILLLFGSSYSEEIGKVTANGIFFKDTITISAIDDPTIQGVTCYITYYDRALSLNDSGRSSISCRQVGSIKGNLTSAKNIYKDSKGWTFKGTILDRFYDEKRGVLVYIAYMDSAGSKNSYHQVSVVPVQKDWK